MIGVDLPEVMLAEALAAGKPTVAFYHSDTCDSCIQMIDVVRQVYSEFENPIVLVDVNVCREVNEPLLQRERITYIPTMVFKDVNGKREVFVGVMKPEQFRDELVRIGGGN